MAAAPTDVDGLRNAKGVTEDQVQQLLALKQAAGPITDPNINDFVVLRFLKAHKFDVAKAAQFLSEHLAWRKTVQLESLVTLSGGPGAQLKPVIPKILSAYPCAWIGVDKEGRPVEVKRLGLLDWGKLFAASPKEQLLQYNAHNNEMLIRSKFPACSVAARKLVDSTTTIIDLDNLSFWLVTNSEGRNFMQTMVGEQSKNYPETAGKIIIVNAPSVFSAVWSFFEAHACATDH
mmetsp:Transcript_44984/g.101865  ORF Transcript_44984/g.101865 Transcript_44984/m.101865 type:complete len:233 (-) Transcript_44984:612-1310(-)